MPHQLTPLRLPLLVQRPSVRRLQRSALVESVAVPLPPAQPDSPARRLQRNSSKQIGKAVRLLRSLSNKFASAPEGTVEQVRAILYWSAPLSDILQRLSRGSHALRAQVICDQFSSWHAAADKQNSSLFDDAP